MMLGIFQLVQKMVKVRHANVGRILELGEANGLHYLVKQHYEGETLAAVLDRRNRLDPIRAAQVFSQAFAALDALYDEQVPGGDLKLDCLVLAPHESRGKGRRILKVLHAGIRRHAFDNAGLTNAPNAFMNDDLELPSTLTLAAQTTLQPEVDIFNLGCAFYQSLAGRPPFSPDELPFPARSACPIRELNPDVSEMLAELVEQMILPNPSHRPQNPRHIAKTLRVILTAEEEGREFKPEDQLMPPSPTADATDEEEVYPLATPKPERAVFTPRATAPGTADAKASAETKEESPVSETATEHPKLKQPKWYRFFIPEDRDYIFILAGAVLAVSALMLLSLLTGLQTFNLVCLMFGMTMTFALEQLIGFKSEK